MIKFSWTLAIAVVFVAYMGHSLWVIYNVFSPTPCISTQQGVCIKPYLSKNPTLQVFTSYKQKEHLEQRDLTLVWKYDNFTLMETVEKTFNVSIPLKTRKNGTLFLHVYVYPRGHDLNSQYSSHAMTQITTYTYPQATFINLLGESTENKTKPATDKVISHWRQKVSINVMADLIAFERKAIPGEVYRYLRISPDGSYLPMVFIDEMSFRVRDLLPINSSSDQLPLTITYSPISVGKLRMWTNFLESFKMLQTLGFTEKDTDEIKGIFADTNFYFLLLTFAVAALHLLFDFLAFKNEITYWKKRKTMVGLSTRAVVWRCISTIIIFFYLMDEKTSLLILIPAGIGALIEVWKVKKALKISISWDKGYIPTFKLEPHSSEEKETEAYDSQAMKYLLYLLYPLCSAGAVYSLLYVHHKSWYSWFLQSLVNGIYALGFLFMLPQLFVNYKMKSVAHLPWRAFMYKAFNTFIDDVFAFIITMPTAHRLACFRDDVVFIIYLYQRWLYPVDKKRVNEYGQSFEEETKKTK